MLATTPILLMLATTAALDGSDPGPCDRILVRFAGENVVEGAREAGSVFVLLLPATRSEREMPADGPWWDRPHPFGVIEIETAPPGGSVDLSSPPPDEASDDEPSRSVLVADAAETEVPVASTPLARWYPGPPERLSGSFRVQAVYRPRADPTPGGPAEWRSGEIEIDLSSAHEDRLDLVLEPPRSEPVPDRIVGPATSPAWIEVSIPSPLLEAAGVASPVHRAWMVLPRSYHDLRASRRVWPTVYVIPHDGDGRREAEAIRDAIAVERTREAMPQAVWVVLDPRSPWGHHQFMDSRVHGPRATALIEEFIPELERRHRLVSNADARLLLGHGAGGSAALHLQLDHPDLFAKAFVTSPELVDLSRLGWLDAYGLQAFTDEEGRPRPAYREVVGKQDTAVRTVIEQEWRMAETASPEGRSGNRWHRWAALAGPRPLDGERAPPLFDDEGRIDRSRAESDWLSLDLAAELVREPRRLIPMWLDRIHVWVGSLDEHGHERSLLSLQTLIAESSADLGMPRPDRNLVRLLPGATFESVVPNSRVEVYRAMIRHLRAAGFAD